MALAAVLIGSFTALITLTLTLWSGDSLLAALGVYMLSGIGGSALILAPVTFRVWMQSRGERENHEGAALAAGGEDQIVSA